MPFVDLTQLTQEEDWAVRYAWKQANIAIAQNITHAEQYNATRPVNAAPMVVPTLKTVQGMADELARSGGIQNAIYNMRNAKQAIMAPAYLAKPLDVQMQVDALLGVEPLLTAEDLAAV